MTDVTADERRKVAWRLRTEVSEGECIDYAVCRIINDVLGVNGAWGDKAARILADLIDPTCEVKDDNRWTSDFAYVCCACGEHFSTCDKPNYCPSCGARVVRDDG